LEFPSHKHRIFSNQCPINLKQKTSKRKTSKYVSNLFQSFPFIKLNSHRSRIIRKDKKTIKINIKKKKRNIEIKTVKIEVTIFNFILKLPFKKQFSFLEFIINFFPLNTTTISLHEIAIYNTKQHTIQSRTSSYQKKFVQRLWSIFLWTIKQPRKLLYTNQLQRVSRLWFNKSQKGKIISLRFQDKIWISESFYTRDEVKKVKLLWRISLKHIWG